MLNNPQQKNNKGKNQESAPNGDGNQSRAPAISLPKGGGAIRGIDEKFSVNPATGTGSLSVPIFTSPSRSDFYPKLSLSYDSGAGNGPFGLGWNLSVPSITRKTDKGLPRYRDAEEFDTFILSGAEDLVPILKKGTGEKEVFSSNDKKYTIQRYRPRIEGLFARIERWQHKETGDIHWRSISKDNITSIYGKSSDCRISDPDDDSRIFKWLLEETFDNKGNVIFYKYKEEDKENIVSSLPQERNRLANGKSYANRYLKRIKYGNKTPYKPGNKFPKDDWLFEVVLDYGEHDTNIPTPIEVQKWSKRPDPFSSFRAGFEIRTQRLCRRILMFHHFKELGKTPCLVRSTDFTYNETDSEQGPIAVYMMSVSQTGYVRKKNEVKYTKKSLPPLEFAYTERKIDEEIRYIDTESLENLPVGLDGSRYQWVDLDGEGISGVLTEQGEGWFYKRNLGNVRFTQTRSTATNIRPAPVYPDPEKVQFAPLELVAAKPSLANLQGGQQQLMDLAGDGHKDLVLLSEESTGFFERNGDNGWNSFKHFKATPNVNWNDSNLRFIDLNGDGHTDILITEDDVFTWYPSLAEDGFGQSESVRKLNSDEEKGPTLVFADTTQSVYLADMSGGDGLTDIVRIRNGEVCYWPNLGYGRFGAKVTMDAPPHFDHPHQFNQNRIRLADIDGSGTTDVIYLGRDAIRIWYNQAGNSWSKPYQLTNFPAIDNLSSVMVADLSGNGTACLVWSSPLPGTNGHQMQYIDLMGGKKPHLMDTIKNNMGAETRLQYASSTKFYLEDIANGTPWITKMPFPVHVVERVEVYDHISKSKFVTLHRYHHGYFDGEEREFRGFGMVEQWDTESFEQFKQSGPFPAIENTKEEFHQPPVYTKTWFHTGAYLESKKISLHFENEYYKGDTKSTLLSDTILPPRLNAKEEREACRALKGQMLRQEVYALDESPKSEHPYTVSENAYRLQVIQLMGDNVHAVFYPYQSEALNYHYERNPVDPRIAHQITLEVDDYGNVTDSVAIAYPRRQPQHTEQREIKITYNKVDVINKTDEDNFYYVGVPYQNRTYEITGISWPDQSKWLTKEDFINIIIDPDSFQPYEWQRSVGQNVTEKRIIEWNRTYFRKNSGTDKMDESDNLAHRLGLGKIESLGLPYETYQAAMTNSMIKNIYKGRVTEAMMKEGMYHREPDQKDYWWIPSGRQAFKKDGFYLPFKSRDPFRNVSQIIYDKHSLLMESILDPLLNEVKAENDYRLLQPKLITDPNDNQSEVKFDALGMVVGTALMGKANGNKGDSLKGFDPDLTQGQRS